MTDIEFLNAVVAVFNREIEGGKTKSAAHKTAEQFRRHLVLSLAAASWQRATTTN